MSSLAQGKRPGPQQSFADLLGQVAARHDTEIAELTSHCHMLEMEVQKLLPPKSGQIRQDEVTGAPSMTCAEPELGISLQAPGPEMEMGILDEKGEAWVEPLPTKSSHVSLSALFRDPDATRGLPSLRKTTSSGLGLKRVLKEGAPRRSLFSSASGALGDKAHLRCAAVLLQMLQWWQSLAEPKRSGCLYRIETSRIVRDLSTVVILANAISITLLTDWILMHPNEGIPDSFQYADAGFVAFFMLEVGLRLIVHRLYFFINDNAVWNWMDFGLVAFSILELALSWSAGKGGNGTIMYLRVFRLFKFAPILRSLRVITAFRELAMMMESFRSCIAAMFWSLVLLLFLVYMSALLFTQGVSDALTDASMTSDEEQVVREHFGSVIRTMLSLYMAVTGGNDWSLYYSILATTGIYQYLFLGYTFFFAFAIYNILTGIFVERAVAANMPDREQQILQERKRLLEQADELRYLFECLDLDSSGFISLDEFVKCMKDPRIVAYMSSVGMSVHDVEYLFRVVANEDSEVEIDRFVDGCMAIKGSATALDMQKQFYHIQQLSSTLKSWENLYWPTLMRALVYSQNVRVSL
mmetsp:Transcript_66846/g.157486  ORF Transcript_66846/g.157486 Transcript_66846/m.157486 type:complete len:582 (+) Transcript_66846:25-1770(+)